MATTPAVADAPLDEDDILLTDAERAGMEDGDEDELDAKPTTDPVAEAKRGDEGENTAPGAADPEPEPEDGFAPTSVPPLRAADTAGATARLTEIEAEQERLAREFDDGEMTATEYRAAVAKLTKEQSDLDWTMRKADLAAEMTAQASEAAWTSDVGTFLNENKAVLKPGSLTLQAFDIAVRQVTGDPANNTMSNRQMLQKAYDRLAAELGIAPAKPPAPAPRAPAKPAMRDLPPNLRDLPASDLETTDNGRFAALDRLMETNPIAYEEALGKLSEAEQDAYSRSR